MLPLENESTLGAHGLNMWRLDGSKKTTQGEMVQFIQREGTSGPSRRTNTPKFMDSTLVASHN